MPTGVRSAVRSGALRSRPWTGVASGDRNAPAVCPEGAPSSCPGLSRGRDNPGLGDTTLLALGRWSQLRGHEPARGTGFSPPGRRGADRRGGGGDLPFPSRKLCRPAWVSAPGLNLEAALQPRMNTDRHGCQAVAGNLRLTRKVIESHGLKSVSIRVHPWFPGSSSHPNCGFQVENDGRTDHQTPAVPVRELMLLAVAAGKMAAHVSAPWRVASPRQAPGLRARPRPEPRRISRRKPPGACP